MKIFNRYRYFFIGLLVCLLFTVTISFIYTYSFVMMWFISINIVTLFMYGLDKRYANSNHWRISERELLGLSLIGGSGGALFAINKLRHKSKKSSYQMKLGVVLLIQVLLVILYLYVFSM